MGFDNKPPGSRRQPGMDPLWMIVGSLPLPRGQLPPEEVAVAIKLVLSLAPHAAR